LRVDAWAIGLHRLGCDSRQALARASRSILLHGRFDEVPVVRRYREPSRHFQALTLQMPSSEPRSEAERIEAFLACSSFAVVGASTDRSKYGNKVLRCYQQHGRKAFPVNPKAPEVEGLPAYPSLAALPEPVPAISVITPPAATEQVVREAHAAGVKHVWMQPGAESDEAIRAAKALGMNVIAGGPCLLVVMGYGERR
jgi:predicted CoA-binding protein